MKTAETNAVPFNPAIPSGVDISIPTEAVCPNAPLPTPSNRNSDSALATSNNDLVAPAPLVRVQEMGNTGGSGHG